MLQTQRLEQMCIVIKEVVLLPFAWLSQAVTAHRNAHEYLIKIFGNSWFKWICATISMGNPTSPWPWQEWLTAPQGFWQGGWFSTCNEPGLEGKWTGTGFGPQLCRQWVTPKSALCRHRRRGFGAFQAVLPVNSLLGFRNPGWISMVQSRSWKHLASKDRAVAGFILPTDNWEPVVLIPLLCSLWHHIDLGLGETSIPLPLGLRLSGTSQKCSLLTALQLLSMGNELSALLTELQLWPECSWEIMSNQCDAVCATIQCANKTGEIFFK